MFFIFLGNSRLSAALSLGGSLLFLLNGNYGLELPLALRQTIHAAQSTFTRMWPVIETASFALLVVTVLLLSGDWWVGEALGRDMLQMQEVLESHLRQLDAVEFSLRLRLDEVDVVAPQQCGDGRRRGDLAVPRQERGVHALAE